MAKNAIRFEGQMTGFASKVDGSLSFRGVTPELSSEEKCSLMDLQGLLVEVLIIPKDEKDSELVEVQHQMDCKTPSARLRSVLFLLFKKKKEQHQRSALKDEPTETFDTFYARKMEAIIEYCKTKIDQDK
jgi:hypothetical protein